jgi:hypothetical protein
MLYNAIPILKNILKQKIGADPSLFYFNILIF